MANNFENLKSNKIRATDVSRFLYFLLWYGKSTNYNVYTSARDGASKSQTEYFDSNYQLILTKRKFLILRIIKCQCADAPTKFNKKISR
jgi:hypothetical protein